MLQILFLETNFDKNFFYKKNSLFSSFSLEFRLFIDFQSSEMVPPQSRSKLDFCMIFANDD